VHCYKIIFFIIINIQFLISENDTLKINFDVRNSKINKNNQLLNFIESWRSDNYDKGQIKKELKLKSLNINRGDLFIIWSDTLSEPVYIDTIIFFNNLLFNKTIVNSISSEYIGKKATNKNLFEFKKKYNYNFIEYLSDPSYLIYNQDKVALNAPIKSNFSNIFSGIIGYNSNSGISGNIDFSLINIFGFSSTMDFSWLRLNEKSQDIFYQHYIPFIKNFNFGILFNFSQSLQNNFFVKYSKEFKLTSFYTKIGKFSFGIKTSNNNPTNIGYDNGYKLYNTKSLSLGNNFDINQHSFFNQKFLIGDYKQNEQKKIIINYFLDSFYNYRLIDNIDLSFLFYIRKVFINDNFLIPDGEKFRFGGAKTFRGYEEFFFMSDQVLINQTELRYKINSFTSFFLFFDFGKVDIQLENIFSYGIGITQPISLGILKLEYAINKFEKISNGKIHFTISTKLK